MSNIITPNPPGALTKDIKFAERTKPSIGDTAAPPPAILSEPAKPADAPQSIEFKRFDNGMVLGFSQNPMKPGTFVIHDATGTPYAVALHPGVADLLCKAVTFLFAEREKLLAKQREQVAQLTDAAEPPPALEPPSETPTTP